MSFPYVKILIPLRLPLSLTSLIAICSALVPIEVVVTLVLNKKEVHHFTSYISKGAISITHMKKPTQLVYTSQWAFFLLIFGSKLEGIHTIT